MDLHTYAAAMCAAFLLGVVVLGAVLIYLLDRLIVGRESPAERPRDPYAQAQALAARRHAQHIGRARVPVGADQAGTPWPR
jgi:uncharacterized iron-regulated membrane protein